MFRPRDGKNAAQLSLILPPAWRQASCMFPADRQQECVTQGSFSLSTCIIRFLKLKPLDMSSNELQLQLLQTLTFSLPEWDRDVCQFMLNRAHLWGCGVQLQEINNQSSGLQLLLKLSCIVGYVGVRFWQGRRKCAIKKMRWFLHYNLHLDRAEKLFIKYFAHLVENNKCGLD